MGDAGEDEPLDGFDDLLDRYSGEEDIDPTTPSATYTDPADVVDEVRTYFDDDDSYAGEAVRGALHELAKDGELTDLDVAEIVYDTIADRVPDDVTAEDLYEWRLKDQL